MASGLTELSKKHFVASQDVQASISYSTSATKTQNSFVTRVGLQGYITSFRQAWDSVLNNIVSFSLLVDGVIMPDYNALTVQTAAPSEDVELPVYIPIPQGATVSVQVAFSATPASAGYFSSRVTVKYYSL